MERLHEAADLIAAVQLLFGHVRVLTAIEGKSAAGRGY